MNTQFPFNINNISSFKHFVNEQELKFWSIADLGDSTVSILYLLLLLLFNHLPQDITGSQGLKTHF